jgi:hypothetical protein
MAAVMMMALGLGAFGFIVSPTVMMALINHQCAACFFETDERYERWDVVCIALYSNVTTTSDCDFTTESPLTHQCHQTHQCHH